MLLVGTLPAALADPPAEAAAPTPAEAPAEGQDLTPHGTLMSSLKQGFSQDVEHESVRGHFDVKTPSGTQRYYCLVDPKTGKGEENGVSGQLVPRRDGTTGIKGAAVTFYRCAEAEQKGMLVTTGYLVRTRVRAEKPTVAPTPQPQALAAPQPAAARAATAQAEVLETFNQFVGAQNAHDRAAVSALLVNSRDFVFADHTGNSTWGSKEALDALEKTWKENGKLEPQLQEARIAEVAPGVAVLVTPLQFSAGSAGQASTAAPLRWSGVFVKTKAGWRLSSVFTTPLVQAQAAHGG
jgi:hypothetical protein